MSEDRKITPEDYPRQKMIYLEDQFQCGLKKGNIVKITRIAENHERGWPDVWIREMNEMVGKEAKITHIARRGIELNDNFYFPFFILDLVELFKSDEVLKCPMCGSPMCVMDRMQDEIHMSENPDIFERAITFEYDCSNQECGMSMYTWRTIFSR